ncbi:mandelate racemase/muconate lactonizing enzyme family protein, partial [Candidatus Latescibacterota bacterium]
KQDLAIAAAIQKEIGEEAVLRPDANSGYGPEEAVEQMRKMRDLGVRFFEDPCSREHLDHLVRCREEIGMGILVNMGVSTPESVTELLVRGAADMLMPDTPSSGGLLRVKKVAEVAAPWKVPCLMHCAHDLGLKTAAITHVAASTANFSGPSDTCYHGLVDDILTEPLQFVDGRLRVPTGPGLGVEVDEEKLEKYRQD